MNIKFKPEQLEKLDEYIIENIEMELQDQENDYISEVSHEIKNWKKALEGKEDLYMEKNDILEIIHELEKFNGYLCSYVIDYNSGGCFGQGYVIVDMNCNYLGFVRTV